MNKNIFIIGGRSNLSRSLKRIIPEAVIIYSNDIKDLSSLLKKAEKSSIIYNVCYKSTLLKKRDSPQAYAKYSFEFLTQFVSICLESEKLIDKVIFSSSSAVYGETLNAIETDRPDIRNLYASLKYSSELFIQEHLARTSIKLQITRIFNMYAGFDAFSVVSAVEKAISEKKYFSLINKGESIRDFIHISDVVEIYRRLLLADTSAVVNIASGTKTTISDLIEIAEAAFKTKLLTTDIKREEIAYSCASTDQLFSVIGNMDFISINQYFDGAYNKIKDGDFS